MNYDDLVKQAFLDELKKIAMVNVSEGLTRNKLPTETQDYCVATPKSKSQIWAKSIKH